jgi:N-acetylmuramoyl-L-alanine amidase
MESRCDEEWTDGPMTVPDSPHVDEIVPACNIEPRRDGQRPWLVILHYTGMASARAAIAWLSCERSRVSCHYVVDEAGRITQLVAENRRAWHAGASVWNGERDVNSASIGIEIQNPGHDDGYPDFPPAQMAAVARLTADICRRHAIAPRHVLAHSDVAPARKIDPGEKFDWRCLHEAGVGHWIPPAPVDGGDVGLGPGASGPLVHQVQIALADYGYGVPTGGVIDRATTLVLSAFQRHFRPARVDGRLDRSTVDTILRLAARQG